MNRFKSSFRNVVAIVIIFLLCLSQVFGTAINTIPALQEYRPITYKIQTFVAAGGRYTFFAPPLYRGQLIDLKAYEISGPPKKVLSLTDALPEAARIRMRNIWILRSSSWFDPNLNRKAGIALAKTLFQIHPSAKKIQIEVFCRIQPSFTPESNAKTSQLVTGVYDRMD